MMKVTFNTKRNTPVIKKKGKRKRKMAFVLVMHYLKGISLYWKNWSIRR
jgi:hypothetical protein